jgi:hypothetical protein
MFSELIDDIIATVKRPSRQNDIIAYANQTLRECQAHKQGAFDRDLIEDQVAVTSSDPSVTTLAFIWDRPTRFRKLRTVSITQTGYETIYPKYKRPGAIQGKDIDDGYSFYYSASNYFVFNAVNVGANLNLAYYMHFRRFQYYAAGSRPAVYDRVAETWSYLNAGTDPVAQAAAQDLVSCWLLLDYYDLIREGTLAKFYKSLQDARSNVSFALYKSLETDMVSNEAWSSLDV